jgi:hypothetical protein
LDVPRHGDLDDISKSIRRGRYNELSRDADDRQPINLLHQVIFTFRARSSSKLIARTRFIKTSKERLLRAKVVVPPAKGRDTDARLRIRPVIATSF